MDKTYFIRPGEGERLDRGYRSGRVLAELPDLEVIELTFEPGFEGVDPHSHPDHTDSFYVLDGEVEFFQDDQWHRVGPGTFLSVPPNVVHGFRPCGGGSVHVLNIHAPRVGFIEGLRG